MTQFAESDVMEFVSGFNTLYLVFGGIRQGVGLGQPPFEFAKTLHEFGVDVVFLRDSMQAWYGLGCNRVGNSISGVVKYLKKRVAKYEHIVILGNSMGGYAALLFGLMISADVTIAFSPQTFIDKNNRLKFADSRWQQQISNLHQKCRCTDVFDLRAYFANHRRMLNRGDRFIIYGDNSSLDGIHAQRMAGLRSVYVYRLRDAGHGAALILRNSGVLESLLRAGVDIPDAGSKVGEFLRSEPRLDLQKATPLAYLKARIGF